MMNLPKKGHALITKMKEWKYLDKQLNRAIAINDFNRVIELEAQREEDQREYDLYMESLPQRFGKSYGFSEYRKDIHNVDLYYTKWERENIYMAKESLKRIKKYEKREGIEHFLDKRAREKEEKEMARLNEIYSYGSQLALI